MDFTIKFYTFQSVGKKISNFKKTQKISPGKLIKKPCLNMESVCAACGKNRVKNTENPCFFIKALLVSCFLFLLASHNFLLHEIKLKFNPKRNIKKLHITVGHPKIFIKFSV
jgi:hypothetical protein